MYTRWFDEDTLEEKTTWNVKRKLEDVIKMNLQEVGRSVNWIELAQDMNKWWAVINEKVNTSFHEILGIFLSSLRNISF